MLLQNFITTVENKSLLGNNAKCVVLAVSGGLDSVALAHLFARYRDSLAPGLKLVLAHFNHGLRGEAADLDEAFCQNLAAGLEMEFVSQKAEVGKLAAEKKVSLEKAARDARYEFLYRVCQQSHAGVLALGHHAGDQVETILMNLRRGSGVLGLAGIPLLLEGKVRRVRPLLNFTRSEIAEYINSKNLSYRTDETNADPAFRRNAVRHQILPEMEKARPEIRRDLLRLGKAARGLWQWVLPRATESLRQATLESKEDRLALDIITLKRMRPALRAEVLRLGARKVSTAAASALGEIHLTMIENLLAEGKSGTRLDLPRGLTAAREYNQFIISKKALLKMELPSAGEEYRIEFFPESPLRLFDCIFAAQQVSAEEAQAKLGSSKNEEYFDASALVWPLVLRRAKPGDRFRPLGAPGSMLVSDFFTNRKVPQAARGKAIVVADAQGIIWLWPHRLAERMKLTAKTAGALRLSLRPGKL